MSKIEEGIKLDFKDVLLKPKRSTLKSRSEVSTICSSVRSFADALKGRAASNLHVQEFRSDLYRNTSHRC